jgi:hypothetical protein
MLARVRGAGAAGLVEREPYFFTRWVDDEWGRFGVGELRARGGAEAFIAAHGGYEVAQAAFADEVLRLG